MILEELNRKIECILFFTFENLDTGLKLMHKNGGKIIK